MFDLLMRDTGGDGVPVPLPGRGLVFLGDDGLMYCKTHDGQVMALPSGPSGPAGPAGPAGAGAAASAFSDAILLNRGIAVDGAPGQLIKYAVAAEAQRLRFTLYGRCTNVPNQFRVGAALYANGVMVKKFEWVPSLTAVTNRSFCVRARGEQVGGVMRWLLSVDSHIGQRNAETFFDQVVLLYEYETGGAAIEWGIGCESCLGLTALSWQLATVKHEVGIA